MTQVDPFSNSLYFSAVASAQQKEALDAKRRSEKNKGVGKSLFSAMVKKNVSQNEMLEQGLPVEIANMTEEEAVVFLKDELDTAGDALNTSASPTSFSRYKKAVSQFMRFIVKNNYHVQSIERPGRNRLKLKPSVPPHIQIEAINKKLDTLANDIWYNHLNKLKMLEKIHEINGLLIDLMAA